jgi:hypothetical protein
MAVDRILSGTAERSSSLYAWVAYSHPPFSSGSAESYGGLEARSVIRCLIAHVAVEGGDAGHPKSDGN